MTGYVTGADLADDAIGLRLIRHTPTRTHFCEGVIFAGGRAAVLTVLNRAGISGRVEIDGEVADHQADVLIDADGGWDQVVALDARSYKALKTRWMPCRVAAVEPV